MILVTGATGTVGRHLVTQLLQAGHPVRAMTRTPAKAALPDGVEVVAGDLTDVGGLAAAFDGVTAAHLVAFAQDGAQVVTAATAAGIRRVTVMGGWGEGPLEVAVRKSDLEWTLLEPIEFMGNTLADWGPRLRRTGEVREPYGDRRSAPVHEADIAAVAATALTSEGHAGQTYGLTGPEVLTPRDKMRILREVVGRDLRFHELTPEETRQEWLAPGGLPHMLLFQAFGGMPDAAKVETLLRIYADTPPVGYTVVDTVERVTGRAARTFRGWAVEHASGFGG